MMTVKEIIERKALLHDQTAQLLREDADRHESEAQRLRDEAALLGEADQ